MRRARQRSFDTQRIVVTSHLGHWRVQHGPGEVLWRQRFRRGRRDVRVYAQRWKGLTARPREVTVRRQERGRPFRREEW